MKKCYILVSVTQHIDVYDHSLYYTTENLKVCGSKERAFEEAMQYPLLSVLDTKEHDYDDINKHLWINEVEYLDDMRHLMIEPIISDKMDNGYPIINVGIK